MSRPISELLALIQSAVYGKDVRGAIHDSIEQCYTDVSTSSTAANTAATAANEAAATARQAATDAESAATAANIAAAGASQYEDKLNEKANIDGYYEELTSGSAEQLLSSKFTEDGVPYVYRKTGGSLDVGNRKLEKIVGGTVVWNQLVQVAASSTTQNGVTITANADGSITFDGTATGNVLFNAYPASPIPTGHVILITGCPSGGSTASYFLADGYGSGAYDIGKGKVYKTFGDQNRTIAQHRIQSGTVCNNLVFKPQIFDLTKMFGATIADYILSLDTANSGAGLEWFRSMFPNAVYAYNEGELMSVHTTQHETVGFNQWDEEWELGTFDTTSGDNITRTDQIRSKNLIPVIPGTSYYLRNPNGVIVWTMFLDENQNIVDPPTIANSGSWSSSGRCRGISNQIFATPHNAHYIRFYLTQNYGNNYKNDICLNLSWTGYRNGEYEPYAKHVYALDDDLTLRGIPKLDANNHIYYDGDTYEADGTVTRRYGVVDLGTLNWASTTTPSQFSCPTVYEMLYHGNLLCTKYQSGAYEYFSLPNGYISVTNSLPNPILRVMDTTYTDVAAFKAAMSGVMLVYELATPTTEQAASYPEVQVVDDFGTERFVDTRTVAVPVGHNTKYMPNLRDKLQHLPDLAASDGDYIIHQANGQMTLTGAGSVASNAQIAQNAANSAIAAKTAAERAAQAAETLMIFPSTGGAAASVATVKDATNDKPMALKISIEPVQDLHGYDNPWPAGGGKNKFTRNGETENSYVNISGAIATTSGWVLSDYIPVKGNTQYHFNPNSTEGDAAKLACYNSQQQFIGYFNSGEITFTTQSDCAYMRFSYRNTSTNIQLEEGSTATAYAPYSNICPISGWTDVKIQHGGRNLFNIDGDTSLIYTDVSIQNGKIVISSLGSGATSRVYFSTVYQPGTYTFSAKSNGGVTNIRFFSPKQFAGGEYNAYYGGYFKMLTNGMCTITTSEPFTIGVIGAGDVAGSYGEIYDIQLERGSTVSAYEPYVSTTHDITFPASAGTVYGGTLEIANDGTGTLTVDRAIANMGSVDWYALDGYFYSIIALIKNNTGWAVIPKLLCDRYDVTTPNNIANLVSDDAVSVWPSGTRVVARDTDYANATSFKAAMNGVQIVYELATPQTYTFTAEQIKSILGINNVSADCGDTQITAYYADKTLFIPSAPSQNGTYILKCTVSNGTPTYSWEAQS